MTKKFKLLVVEDDDDSRETLTLMLEALGYEVHAYSSGVEVMSKIEQINVDLALLDIMMPKMNGYELMKNLRAVPKFANTPIIFVTAKDQDNEVIEGYQGGADYYITKPFTSKQLDYGIKLFINS